MAKTTCDTGRLKVGDKWSRISYGEISGITRDGIIVKNEQGLEWSIAPSVFEKEFSTPDQFTKVVEVTRSDMVTTIVGSTRTVMTVNYKKKPDPKVLKEKVIELLDDEKGGRKRPGTVKLGQILRVATAGEERTMIGRHFGQQDEYGRIQFTDMEAAGVRLRQVDPRTVEWAIIGNVKYVLKT